MSEPDCAVCITPDDSPDYDVNANKVNLNFQPPLSSFSVSTCWPAGSETFAVTVVQVCQPPVAGTLTGPLRLAPDEFERWNASVTPVGPATPKLTVYPPPEPTLPV